MTDAMSPLHDVFDAPLAGLSLVEASAGTGKTHTITSLYLRLVLEAERPVNRILVVTYTKAATEELRERIRDRLLEVREAFVNGASENEFCRKLLARYTDEASREHAARRLTNAIRGFDAAAIFTIHGFCQRVLSDDAFESGMPFEVEILPDQRELLQEIVDDFWRKTFYRASPLLVNYLLDEEYTPEKLLTLVQPHVGKPYLKVVGPEQPPDFAAAETAFADAYSRLRRLWPDAKAPVEALLRDSTALNANKYRKTSIPGWIAMMSEYLNPETPNLKLFECFEKFTVHALAASVKKGHKPPQHPIFGVCEALAFAQAELARYYQWYLRALRVELLRFCNRELVRRKRRKQVQSYDDLLNNLNKALFSSQGKALAESVRNRYTAALIDEFQDTDPVQYSIFRRIYGGAELPVLLVGDPKQAIYSFRGADIFAYLEARNDALRRYTLNVNWRSDPDLIAAVNAVFGNARRPFLLPEIPFQPAQPAAIKRKPLLIEGEKEPPFKFWFVGWDENGKAVGKTVATDLAASATAVEIARLLNLAARGEALIDRPLDGGDIAVLVRNHRQARLVRDELLKLGVPSVQQAQDNVFHAHEAMELERVLLAVAEPGQETLVRAALTTDMLGVRGDELYRMGEDDAVWESSLNAFHEYHRLWREHGFIRMFRTLCSEEDVARRLLGFRDGERRLTNLLHLAELLQTTASRQRTGMDGLLKWFSERRLSEAAEDEAHQLRLESDENLVKIVTVHKSKGLQYPVVFCPFLWDGKLWAEKQDTFVFHDPNAGNQAVLDLGSEHQEEWRRHARREELAENLRLLYVALTRAQYHCYMVWGAIKGSGTSAPAWLLHSPPGASPPLLRAVGDYVENLSEDQILTDLTEIAEQVEGAIRIESLPEDSQSYQPPKQEQPQFVARHFPGPIRGRWRIASFTGLIANRQLIESPDYDALTLRAEAGTPARASAAQAAVRNIFSFPRGARAGSCLHSIFERLDFTRNSRTELEKLVQSALEAHGFGTEWTAVASDMVERVLATPLGDGGRRLQNVSWDRRLNELEFYYPLTGLEVRGLKKVLAAHGWPAAVFRDEIENLSFSPVRGYMKGFIDLVFEADGLYYLVDYKSNWLGPNSEDYGPERMAEVMAREAYYLQYLIYAVALHRYLSLRLSGYDYERHFGGVFYLFLRGMDPAKPEVGVYHDRPAQALIDSLDAFFKGGEGA